MTWNTRSAAKRCTIVPPSNAGAPSSRRKPVETIESACWRIAMYRVVSAAENCAHLIRSRQRLHGAEPGGCERGCDVCPSSCGSGRVAGNQAGQEVAGETVAGARGINRLDGKRCDGDALSAVVEQRAILTELQHGAARAGAACPFENGLGIGQSGQSLHVLQAGKKPIDRLQGFAQDGACTIERPETQTQVCV